jgi:hypothetical protein
MACKCDSCGKFRKESDCVLQEYTCMDGMQVDQWLECRWCMSLADAQRYFPEKYPKDKDGQRIQQRD